jgi:hypothetical protein
MTWRSSSTGKAGPGSGPLRKTSGRKEESSFFEKKEAKKLFSHEAVRLGEPAPADKVFLLLFVHKKKIPTCLA